MFSYQLVHPPWLSHEPTKGVDSKTDVRSSVDQILQRTNQLSIQGGINQIKLKSVQVLQVGCHRRRHWPAICHLKYPQDIHCIFSLSQENQTCPLPHLLSQKIMHQPNFLHLKLKERSCLQPSKNFSDPVRNRSSTYKTRMRGSSPTRMY